MVGEIILSAIAFMRAFKGAPGFATTFARGFRAKVLAFLAVFTFFVITIQLSLGDRNQEIKFRDPFSCMSGSPKIYKSLLHLLLE